MGKLKCKPGDLAIVIQDEPGCEANLGRLVKVSGPLDTDRHGRPTWLVQPVHDPHWTWLQHRSEGDIVMHGPCPDDVEHPDAWLMPLRKPPRQAKRPAEESNPVLLGQLRGVVQMPEGVGS